MRRDNCIFQPSKQAARRVVTSTPLPGPTCLGLMPRTWSGCAVTTAHISPARRGQMLAKDKILSSVHDHGP
jgi:hypothetical protein